MTPLPQHIDETDDLKDLYGDWDYEGVIPVPTQDFWVFGYGSLIWNPGFPHKDAQIARVSGYHRRFCVESKVYRGTPDNPGLVMGLLPGGQVVGRAFQVSAEDAAQTIEYLERRELRFEAYDVKWLKAALVDGRHVKVMTFVMQRQSPSLARCAEGNPLSTDEVVRRLGTCHGRAGSNREYLDNVCTCLAEEGIGLGKLGSLKRKVDAAYPA